MSPFHSLVLTTSTCILLFLNLVSAAAYSENSAQYLGYNPNWYNQIQYELGPRLSPEGAVLFPNSTIWTETTQRWTAISFTAKIIAAVDAGTTEDVKKAVKYATTNGIPFIVRNTGHGWTGSYDKQMPRDGIVISVRKLSKISINSKRNTMTVQAGAKNFQVINALYAAKKRSTTGSCDCPGYAGLFLGGGHGRFQSLYGLVSDNLLSAVVLTSTNQVVTASRTSNPDLFWALRGAGHNFGFILEATAKIYDPTDGDNWLVVDYIYPGSPSKVTALFTYLNNLRPTQPDLLSIFAYMTSLDPTQPERVDIRLSIQYGGKEKNFSGFNRYRRELLAMGPRTKNEVVVPWNLVAKAIGVGEGEGYCAMGGPKSGYYTTLLKGYNTTNMVDVWRLLEEVRRKPELKNFRNSIGLFESYPLRRFQEIESEESAYPHRDMSVIAVFLAITDKKDGSNDREMEVLGEKGRDILVRGINHSRRTYVNYAIGNEGPKAIYYGDEPWRQKKLETAKKKWDPRGYFSTYNPVT